MMTNNKEQRLILFAFLILAVYLSPLFLLGENAHIRVHDNLDSNLAWYKVLARSGQIFGSVDAVIPQIINGLPRNAFGSEFTVIVWLFVLFPTMVAYALSQTITRVIAFLGMYLLLKKHFIKSPDMAWITVGTALAFSLTPFWPSGMLSTLGMPLALWAFLNIRNGERSWKNYLTLTLLPFYSSIVLGFFFFLFSIGVLWVIDLFRKKEFNLPFLLAIAYMAFIYFIVEYRLVHSFLFDNEPNSRDEYFHARLSLWRAIRLTFKNFVLGHTHVMTVHGLIILPVTLISVYVVVKKRLWKQEKIFIYLFALNFALSAWYAFWFYKGWLPLTERFHFMDTFNFARFHFLRPLVIYMGFALGLKIIWTYLKGWKSIVHFFIVAQILLLAAFNDEIIYQSKPSVKEFYAEDLFSDIKEHINSPLEDYRVASLGIHPAIPQYNGFYTLDTYNNFYPLEYKYQFRKIIEQELAKNKTIRIYFDEWGGRCYLFTDELGKHYMFKKDSKKRLDTLELNIEPFKEMGGRYILSALPIDNALENQLQLDKVFTSDTAAWKIYLYKVNLSTGGRP
ncbi:hypothetical protein CVD25_11270 [Bacillus canaveralius]|uniref:YkoS n=1 Tax=Bacillus canaveralius TaxID=1403243 RepID=A0A2N5GLR3_9BACI|nr:DUF6044 family protein [Bacillus canaveralius]PLR82799.1 hypothetical protein CU635_09925 [Bacillus canaveralius]PLR97196.1 hypothetical protein CVD25_11270 [Bacillus canaveralius]